MTFKIIQGDNRDVLKTIADNSIDAIVTDPPYGIDFLGKAWDANTGALETYQECLRVLKPGGYILAFSAARTYHHLAITLEQAGFEIRDQLMWIYCSGFPKSQDVGKSIERTNKKKGCNDPSDQWQGWGTALKPAHEPICMARKPTKVSIAKNVLKWGTGALNIDACKFSVDNKFPSNVIGDIIDYQNYFYCPKVSRAERHCGFDEDIITQQQMLDDMGGHYIDKNGNKQLEPSTNLWLPHTSNIYIHGLKHEYELWCKANGKTPNVGNNHPTVKPVALMEYLIRLVTPQGGHVLDPFNGSGSTGMAAVGLGYEYTGIELDPNYVKIAEKRIQAWRDRNLADNTFNELFLDETQSSTE